MGVRMMCQSCWAELRWGGQARVVVETVSAARCGVAWVEAEAGGLLGRAVPVVLADSADLVREIRLLEPDLATGRRARGPATRPLRRLGAE